MPDNQARRSSRTPPRKNCDFGAWLVALMTAMKPSQKGATIRSGPLTLQKCLFCIARGGWPPKRFLQERKWLIPSSRLGQSRSRKNARRVPHSDDLSSFSSEIMAMSCRTA
jgi:hypothetical protein